MVVGELNNAWFKQAICYSAANNMKLWGHMQDLHTLVGEGSQEILHDPC